MRRLVALLAAGLVAGAASAQEFVTAKDLLSDEDFYRLVACAAPPVGDCQKPLVRWEPSDAKALTVGIVQIDDGYPSGRAAKAEAALDAALGEVNGSGAALRLSRPETGRTPHIRVFLLDLPRGSRVAGTDLPWFDGQPLATARMQAGWRDDGSLFVCAIAVSRDAGPGDLKRIMLEELVQCLGLMTDIGGRAYESRSIFSESSGLMDRLQGQDLAALRRHYP